MSVFFGLRQRKIRSTKLFEKSWLIWKLKSLHSFYQTICKEDRMKYIYIHYR